MKQLAAKKSKQRYVAQGITAEQVNVTICVGKWAETTPEILVAYSLFCDLVHPNLGSAFLVASSNEKGLYFTPSRGTSLGFTIFEQSFPILVSTTMKPFGDHLVMLMGTIWQAAED